jgi:hypothetical protein
VFEEAQVGLYVDHQFRCHCRDGLQGMLCLLSAYYIFNMDVPSKVSIAFSTLNKLLFDIRATSTPQTLSYDAHQDKSNSV